MNRKAFTLVELLGVIALIGILLAFIVPAASGTLNSFALTRQGQLLTDQINLCRQMAFTRNQDFELRIVDLPNPPSTSGGWGLQIWKTSGTPAPASNLIRLPDNITLSKDLSPLFRLLESKGSAQGWFQAVNSNRPYWPLRFRANGRISDYLGSDNFLTLCSRHESDLATPKNFYTIQINPFTGSIGTWRP